MKLKLRTYWLSALIALGGSALSIWLWYTTMMSAKSDLIGVLRAIETSLHWILLILGITISGLLSIATLAIQLAKQRAVSLDKTHQHLKEEVAGRIETEETKQKLEKALLQGQKLQAVGTLAGGIAHDFNNILYAIKGYMEITREDVPKDSISYANLGKVLEAAQRGEELVSRILAFSRRQHHELKPLELNSTLEAVLDLLRPTIPASVMIHFEAECTCTVLGNQTQLHQVIVNIINNAVDAIDGEGDIYIKLSQINGDNSLLRQYPQLVNHSCCKIEISDAGYGMDPQTVERIFEPFFTTKEVGKGTGLGLSIVHSIMKDHHGEVNVSSQLGHGTTFTLLLPESTELVY